MEVDFEHNETFLRFDPIQAQALSLSSSLIQRIRRRQRSISGIIFGVLGKVSFINGGNHAQIYLGFTKWIINVSSLGVKICVPCVLAQGLPHNSSSVKKARDVNGMIS
jgi:hypothetical protein